MKRKDEIKELRSKTEKELLALLRKSYEDLSKHHFQEKIKELKNINKIKAEKIKIARILTILREKMMEKIDEKKA